MSTNLCQPNFKMPNQEIKVPNIGEFKDVEVIEVLVSSGQSISKNDPLITIESDKSSVEIPSSFEGKIKSINVKVGDKVSEGDVILILENNTEIKKKNKEDPKTTEEPKRTETKKIEGTQNKIEQKKIKALYLQALKLENLQESLVSILIKFLEVRMMEEL